MSSLVDHIDTIERYRLGMQPGSCTRAILAMDLEGVILNLDRTTWAHVPEVVRYIIDNLPTKAWGSYEKVDEWLKSGHA